MADDKIVTKKTAVKPAAPANRPPAAAAPVKKTVAKKTLPRAASPAPAPPAKAKAPSEAPAAVPKVAATAKKVLAKAAEPARAPVPAASPQLALEEKPVSLQHLARVTADQRLAMIREAAYFKAEKRNFAVGHEAYDWAEAEREIDEILAKAQQIYGA